MQDLYAGFDGYICNWNIFKYKLVFEEYFFVGNLGKEDFVASELKDPICHSNECQIWSFSSEATI